MNCQWLLRATVLFALASAGDSDDVFYDAKRRRVYVIGGEGAVDIFGQRDPVDVDAQKLSNRCPR
jgi:hypothetical protein